MFTSTYGCLHPSTLPEPLGMMASLKLDVAALQLRPGGSVSVAHCHCWQDALSSLRMNNSKVTVNSAGFWQTDVAWWWRARKYLLFDKYNCSRVAESQSALESINVLGKWSLFLNSEPRPNYLMHHLFNKWHHLRWMVHIHNTNR